MEYQDFLQGTGATRDNVTEEDFENLIRPVIEDRRDLFPTDEAVIAYYNNFSRKGFSDDYFSMFDDLVNRFQDVKLLIGIGRHRFLKFVELAVEQV